MGYNIIFSFILHLLFTLPQCRTYSPPPELTTKVPVVQMPVGGTQNLAQNIRQIFKGGPPWICGQKNVRTAARDNTGRIPSPRIEIKIPLPARNRTGPPRRRFGRQGL